MSTRTFRYSSMSLHIPKGRLASTGRDALAFLEVAQIYNTNQQRAIVNLVRSLKRAGLWSKMKAIYPFVGGTASSHKWNLKDPRDADAAFRLSFQGGWTHSANGAATNGTNAYADTLLNPSNSLTIFNAHLSLYSRTAALEAVKIDMGNYVGTGTDKLFCLILPRDNGNGFASHVSQISASYFALKSGYTSATGYWVSNRTSNTNSSFALWRNGNKDGTPTATDTAGTFHSNNVYIGGLNNGGTAAFLAQKQYAFATIGDGLTDNDATNLYNIVDLYQRRLGRNV